MKRTLLSAVLAVAAALPFNSVITQPSVYAQEEVEEERDMPLSASLEMASADIEIDKENETNFFPPYILENRDSLALLSSHAESDMLGHQIEARFYLGQLFQKMGDYVRARVNFQFVIDNEPKDAFPLYQASARTQLHSSNHFNGSVTGNLSEIVDGKKRPVMNGLVALFDGHEWNFSIVNRRNFSFLYEQNRLIQNTKLPMVFFSEGKTPVYRLLDTNNESTDLGEIVLETPNEAGSVSKIGFTYRLIEEEFLYGIELVEDKQVMFCPGVTKDGFAPIMGSESNEDGFYKFTIEVENFRLEVKEGTILENQKLE